MSCVFDRIRGSGGAGNRFTGAALALGICSGTLGSTRMFPGADVDQELCLRSYHREQRSREQVYGGSVIGVVTFFKSCRLKTKAGKRKGRDPELSQLLKIVLEKLGNDDTDSSDVASDNDVNGTNSSRPRRSHVAPRAAFPPVKNRNKGRAPASQSSLTVVTLPEQASMPEIPVPSSRGASEHQVGSEGTITTPGQSVAEVLANIRKSLASLSPLMGSGVPPSPLPVVPSATLTMAPRHLSYPHSLRRRKIQPCKPCWKYLDY
ncbi:hypothetical protein NDU88_007004 [Pleurodeles waltl]|uniref:Uncharacterized protein n=1 Tax=Pleurodeles waltl TaxID=8319 RepID=A0AAV7MHQ1_PLEWA|nr:hypothetical protein NDU88_007004 [Pleurodeles waltl]